MQWQGFDAAYVSRLAAGDLQTETHFVRYFSELLLIKLRRTLRSSQGMEDVRQETFLRVFRALRTSGVASPERLGAFVNGVCNNVLSEYYRAAARSMQMVSDSTESRSPQPDPEQQLQSTERRLRVAQVLQALPPRDRRILRLVFFEDLDKDEVCRICNVDRGYLRVLLHRAKNKFRERLPVPQPERRGNALAQSA